MKFHVKSPCLPQSCCTYMDTLPLIKEELNEHTQPAHKNYQDLNINERPSAVCQQKFRIASKLEPKKLRYIVDRSNSLR